MEDVLNTVDKLHDIVTENLKVLMKKKNINARQLSEATNHEGSYVSQLMRKRTPAYSIYNLCELANYFEIPLWELFVPHSELDDLKRAKRIGLYSTELHEKYAALLDLSLRDILEQAYKETKT